MSHATRGEKQRAQECTVSNSKAKFTTVPAVSESGTSKSDYKIHIHVNNTRASCLVDTGAAVSLISKELWDKMKETGRQPPLDGPDHNLVGVQGVPLKLYGACTVEVMFGGIETTFSMHVQVADSITTDVILG